MVVSTLIRLELGGYFNLTLRVTPLANNGMTQWAFYLVGYRSLNQIPPKLHNELFADLEQMSRLLSDAANQFRDQSARLSRRETTPPPLPLTRRK